MSSYKVETNSIVLVEFGSGAEQIGTKEEINSNSMSTINSVSSGEGYVEFAKSNNQLEAVLTKSILKNGINSLTVEYTPVSSGDTVISEVINASNNDVLAKTVTKGSTHQNNVVLGFTGGNNNYLRLSTDGLSIRLHRLLANTTETFTYLGFYIGTPSSEDPVLAELVLTLRNGTTFGSSNFDNDYANVHPIFNKTTRGEDVKTVIFDGDTAYSGTGFVWTKNQGAGFYMYITLSTPVTAITSGAAYTYTDSAGFDFANAAIYGTNIDPSTMSDKNTVTGDWTHLVDLVIDP